VVVGFWGHAIGSDFLLQLAAVGFLINLFNLIPMLPLDGGRAAAALHPAIWFVGLIGLLVYGFVAGAPIVLFILILGGFELWKRWTNRNSPSSVAYYSLRPQQRLTIGTLYVVVVAATLVGLQLTYAARSVKF
jgi:Zn-dependent protease